MARCQSACWIRGHVRSPTNFLLHYLSNAEQDVVFDVGANVGYYSVLTHRVCGESVPVHAIEAEPENYRQLQHNLSRSNAASVVPHFCAVSDQPGESKLYLWKSSNRGKHSLVPFEGAETVTVKTRTLDEICRDEVLEARRSEPRRSHRVGLRPGLRDVRNLRRPDHGAVHR